MISILTFGFDFQQNSIRYGEVEDGEEGEGEYAEGEGDEPFPDMVDENWNFRANGEMQEKCYVYDFILGEISIKMRWVSKSERCQNFKIQILSKTERCLNCKFKYNLIFSNFKRETKIRILKSVVWILLPNLVSKPKIKKYEFSAFDLVCTWILELFFDHNLDFVSGVILLSTL